MWSDRDLEEQYVPDHLMNHLSVKPKENGIDYRHAISSHDNLDSHNHLLGHGGDMLTDAMLGHIGDQVKIPVCSCGQVAKETLDCEVTACARSRVASAIVAHTSSRMFRTSNNQTNAHRLQARESTYLSCINDEEICELVIRDHIRHYTDTLNRARKSLILSKPLAQKSNGFSYYKPHLIAMHIFSEIIWNHFSPLLSSHNLALFFH